MEKAAAGEEEESGRQKFGECVGVRGEEPNNRETGRPEEQRRHGVPRAWMMMCRGQGSRGGQLGVSK